MVVPARALPPEKLAASPISHVPLLARLSIVGRNNFLIRSKGDSDPLDALGIKKLLTMLGGIVNVLLIAGHLANTVFLKSLRGGAGNSPTFVARGAPWFSQGRGMYRRGREETLLRCNSRCAF